MTNSDLGSPPGPHRPDPLAGWWRSDKAIPLHDSLDALLDDLELLVGRDEDDSTPQPGRISTGVDALDLHCGGVRPGHLTLIEADQAAQANALVCTIARTIEVPALLAVPVVQDATTWIVAGETGVPAALVAHSILNEREWQRISNAMSTLAPRRLWLTESDTVDGIAHLCDLRRPQVVVVQAIERLGPAEVIHELDALAQDLDVAVLATSSPIPDSVENALDGCTRIHLLAHHLASRATLISTSHQNLLNVNQAAIETLVADIQ